MFFIDLSQDNYEQLSLFRFLPKDDLGNVDPLDSFFLDSLFKRNLERLTLASTYQVVVEEGRPDLISYRVYGDTRFWWIIMAYNNLTDFRDIKTGLVLDIPEQNSILNLVNRLKSIETFYNG